ncbi:MAG: hypothetical protein IJM79_01185 [Erysipelotrichaceae bacterium]|nr:hypothetical protein [Erysipelotrichaceae bacterium]
MNPLINPGISAILKQMKKNRETDSEKKLYDVLFLDYDGVINIVNKNYSIDRFESRRMENINRLCREFGLKIVVTSSWRLFPNYGELLYENGLDPDIEVLGCTESTGPRETEIKNYLMQHIYINRFIILDDGVFNELSRYQVRTKLSEGFDGSKYEEAKELLEKLYGERNNE